MPLGLLAALTTESAISGERLAEQFGCTRAAIAKRISHLKDMGVLIEAIPRVGYRLLYHYDWWHESLLSARFVQVSTMARLHLLSSVDSTNIWMRNFLMDADINETHLVVTDFQRAGQGRRGRQWLSLPGRQITASIGHVSSQGPTAWLGVAIAIGLSLALTLRNHGWPITLKWPNDLWLDGSKLGGILVEMDAMAEGPSRLIIGFGINEMLLPAERAALARRVAALKDQALSYDRHALFAELSAGVLAVLNEFPLTGLAPWQSHWRELDAMAGHLVRFEHQGQWRSGVAGGIDAHGALLVDTPDGMVSCHSGEVSIQVEP